MFKDWYGDDLTDCPECGERFESAFDAIDHLMEDDEEFDPTLILPNGYRLLVGSLLRGLYVNRHNPDFIKNITESTYATLFTAEFKPEVLGETVEDIIVETEMEKFDVQLKNLFRNGE